MLTHIYIKNFAIIDEQTVPFSEGFNVLSGETGAGKSILIDALGLQLGDRADSSWIRHGTARCDIQSDYQLPKNSEVYQWLVEHELDDEDSCQLRRTLSDNGKSKCYINGIPTTVGNTKQLGRQLVDIHGQHAHQSLTNPEQQLDLLDGYANHHSLQSIVSEHYQAWQRLVKQKKALENSDNSLGDKRDLLRYQLAELHNAELIESEFETLTETQQQLASANEILTLVQQIEHLLHGDDMSSLSTGLSQASSTAEKITTLDARATDAAELFNQAQIYLDEAQSALTHYASSVDLDPERLHEIDTRMGILHDLARKHHIAPEQLIEQQQQLETQLTALEQTLLSIDSIDHEIAEAEKAYLTQAKKLRHSREKAAKSLTTAIHQRLTELSLENARFHVEFNEASPKSNGIDNICFLFAPNPGQGMKPLHKIASGGELSRISLAIQVASVAEKSDATLIFDEVDSGVGGATAEVIGRLLKTLSQYNQVICVTHLAQVAAFSDQHIFISKRIENAQTFTQFTLLNETDKVTELARMSGGIEMDEKTTEHAQKMRDNAIQFAQALKP